MRPRGGPRIGDVARQRERGSTRSRMAAAALADVRASVSLAAAHVCHAAQLWHLPPALQCLAELPGAQPGHPAVRVRRPQAMAGGALRRADVAFARHHLHLHAGGAGAAAGLGDGPGAAARQRPARLRRLARADDPAAGGAAGRHRHDVPADAGRPVRRAQLLSGPGRPDRHRPSDPGHALDSAGRPDARRPVAVDAVHGPDLRGRAARPAPASRSRPRRSTARRPCSSSATSPCRCWAR